MGRARVIDRQAVLDAAERVVARAGAAHLTLEAVAAEAGISKASVIYDYKTKNALIKAVIERAIARHTARLAEHAAQQPAGPDRAMRGRLAACTARSVSDAERSVALSLIAALAGNPELREVIAQAYRAQMAEAVAEAGDPRRTRLAFLALEGLTLMERFGFFAWPPAERERLLDDIGGMLRDGWDDAPQGNNDPLTS